MSGEAPAALPDVAVGPAPVPGEPVELRPGVVRLTAPNPGLMTGPGTNTYLVGTEELAVIDPGPDDPVHRQRILAEAARCGAIRWVLVTHTHPDHAPGAAALAEMTGAEQIGFESRDGFVPDHRVGDGWSLATAVGRLRALHTPGHASNHLCWLLDEEGLVFSGDHVMQGSTVVIPPPDGDMVAYLASVERLLALGGALRGIAPGHGRFIAEPAAVLSAILVHRREREQLVEAALRQRGPAGVDDLLGPVYSDVDDERRAVARRSLWAHLRKLVADGRAVLETEPGEAELETGRWAAAPGRVRARRR